jgi:hypothetical protein
LARNCTTGTIQLHPGRSLPSLRGVSNLSSTKSVLASTRESVNVAGIAASQGKSLHRSKTSAASWIRANDCLRTHGPRLYSQYLRCLLSHPRLHCGAPHGPRTWSFLKICTLATLRTGTSEPTGAPAIRAIVTDLGTAYAADGIATGGTFVSSR